MTHLPYRSWCKISVAARGYAQPHGLIERDEHETPLVSLDYWFLGEREEPGCLANLLVKDASTKVLFAISVPQKGVHKYVVDRVCRFLDSLGYKRIRLRCDNEPSILALREAIKDCWTGEAIIDNTPKGEHQANGSVESGVRTVSAQTRALKLQLQSRYGIELDRTSP